MTYVIRYADGSYNQGAGYPVGLSEATRYLTHAAAAAVLLWVDDAEIVEIDDAAEAKRLRAQKLGASVLLSMGSADDMDIAAEIKYPSSLAKDILRAVYEFCREEAESRRKESAR